MVGASGAAFGLIGLLIGHTYRRGGAQGANLRAFLVRWAIYGLVIGFLPGFNVDNAAHIGGLATGLVLGLLVGDQAVRGSVSTGFWRFAALAAVALTGYGYVAAALSPHA
jgi:rhomboid protease GluP